MLEQVEGTFTIKMIESAITSVAMRFSISDTHEHKRTHGPGLKQGTTSGYV